MMRIKKRSLDDLRLDPGNVRKHSDRNIEAIAESIKRFGFQSPVVVDKHGTVRKGNGTVIAAKALGFQEVPTVESDLEDAEAIAYAIADNRTAELAEWDTPALVAQLEALSSELSSAAGFTEIELERMAAGLSESGPARHVEFDASENVSKVAECPHCGQRFDL